MYCQRIEGLKGYSSLKCGNLKSEAAMQHRKSHMETLAEHFAVKQETKQVIEVIKIKTSERTRATAAKHKWYLKERHGMIQNLIIPDYRVHNILAIIGAMAFTLLILQLLTGDGIYTPELVIATGFWGIFTVWEQVMVHDGWKCINNERVITKRLLICN